jgi:hypothetical protein
MSSKINIGCSNIDNIVHFLRNKFNVVKPYITFQQNKIQSNFDWYYSFDDDIYTYHKIKNTTDNIFGYPRLPKYEQIVLLNRLDIQTPKTYKVIQDIDLGSRDDAYYEMLEKINDEEKILIKADNGARGIGQVLLTKNQMYELIDDIGTVNFDLNVMLEKYDIGAKHSFRSEGEKKFLIDAISSNEYSIQKMVDIKEEYRFIYFYGCEPIIVQRKVGDSWQANTSITGEGECIKYNSSIEKYYQMFKIAEKISNYTTMPIISIDFYLDANNELGIFEFQAQFGYKLAPKTELTIKVKNAIQNMINELSKKDIQK